MAAKGNKIAAIAQYREITGVSLKEAKDAVDLIQAEMRREGYSRIPSAPAISDDPFAEETLENRRRMIIFVAVVLVAVGAFALFFVLRSAV